MLCNILAFLLFSELLHAADLEIQKPVYCDKIQENLLQPENANNLFHRFKEFNACPNLDFGVEDSLLQKLLTSKNESNISGLLITCAYNTNHPSSISFLSFTL